MWVRLPAEDTRCVYLPVEQETRCVCLRVNETCWPGVYLPVEQETRYVYLPVERCCVFRRQTRGSLMSRQASSHTPPTAEHCTLAYDSLCHHWQSADTQHGDGFSHWGRLQCNIYQTSVNDRHTQTACHGSAISVLGFQLKFSFSINFPV